MERVTIKDVAREANVSIATVSLILNGKAQNIAPSTIKRVQDVCAALNYKRNINASTLKSKISKLAGIIVPDLENAYYSRIASQISNNLYKCGYSLLVASSENDFSKEVEYIYQMSARQVDALFLIPSTDALTHEKKPELENALDRSGLKIIILDRKTAFDSYVEVLNDDLCGGSLACEHLINKGYKRIACITGPKNVSSSDNRLMGYKDALEKHNIKFDKSLIYVGDYHFDLAKQLALEILKRDDVDAIFAFNDVSAYAVYEAADELNKKVGQDIAVVGFDNNPFSSLITPKLTTVGQDIGLMCETAVAKMFENTGDLNTITVKPHLVERKSA